MLNVALVVTLLAVRGDALRTTRPGLPLAKLQAGAIPAESTRAPLDIGAAYEALTREHYYEAAFVQAATLASCADVATQTLQRVPVDYAHVAAMATVAATMSGAVNAMWLRQLEERWPGREFTEVATKTIIHAVILASIINSAYLAGVPHIAALYGDAYAELGLTASKAAPLADAATVFRQALASLWPATVASPTGASVSGGWDLDAFKTLTVLELGMFVPYNALAFTFVPPSVRPLTHAAVSATFNVCVSAVTLGYFDQWVHALATR